MKNKILSIIIMLVIFVCGLFVGFTLTMENIKVITINTYDNIIELEIFKQIYVFEQ